MPMLDAYIPRDALPAEVERELVSRLTDLLVEHELRRTIDLSDDTDTAEASRKRARAIAWVFVHRPEVYVGGQAHEAPDYKFEIRVPEGQADDEFRLAVAKDVTQAVADAEAGRWPFPHARVWVFTWEVPEGTWAAAGQPIGLRDVIGWVAPELSHLADGRLAARKRDEALAVIEAAGIGAVAGP